VDGANALFTLLFCRRCSFFKIGGNMTTRFDILQQGVADIGDAAREARLRFSEADGETLITEYQKAAKEQLPVQLRAEDLANKSWLSFCGTRQMKATWQARSEQVYLQVVRVLGAVAAIRDVVDERLRRNGVNRNFGFLKIAGDYDDGKGMNKAFDELRRIARSIPWNQVPVWRHPDGPPGFDSKANLVLARELEKIRDTPPMIVLAQMLDNKFAYIYQAFKNGFCDDIRSACRRPEGRPQADVDNVVDPSRPLEATIDVKRTADLVVAAEADFQEPGTVAVLDEVKQWLGDPKSLRYMSVREVQAELVRRVANREGVSDRQARNCLYSLRADTNSKNLQALRELSATEPDRRRGQECPQGPRDLIYANE
jgi:hypothetical protein